MNNPSYTRYEDRERHAMIDQVRSNSLEALDTPEIAGLLGGRALLLANVLEHITVPNLRHGVVTPTHGSNELVEMIALHTNEQVNRRYPDMSFNAIQEQNLHSTLPDFAQQLIDEQQSYYNDRSELFPISTFEDLPRAAAHIFKGTLPRHSTQGILYMQGRPLVVLNADRYADRHPAFVLHELMHVQQIHTAPIMNPYTKPTTTHTENELEAYHVSAQIIRGQHSAQTTLPRLNVDISHELLDIDAIRQYHQRSRKRPFRVTKILLRDLHRHNHTIVTADADRYR